MSDNIRIYSELKEIYKEVQLLNSINYTLEWDERTHLPENASVYRAEQLAYLSGLAHKKQTDPKIGDILSELEAAGYGEDNLDPMDVNIRQWRRDYNLKTKLPILFVEEHTRVTILAQSYWKNAREQSDFELFKPWLEKIIGLKKQEADYYGYQGEPYDALLDQYEPGAKTDQIAEILTGLKETLIPLLEAVKNSSNQPDSSILTNDFPPVKQEKFAVEVAAKIGFDFANGRLDETIHPFCTTLGPKDVRITTRYMPNFLNSALFGVIHEAGHGIYEQNVRKNHWGTPMGEVDSLGLHESQSRLWENLVGRNKSFWEYWYSIAQTHFDALKDVSRDDFYFAINEVKPSFIRVEADEMTYNLHILLRFELEREIMNDNLRADDVPDAWNAKFNDFFGVRPPDDVQGCLQDIHWSAGLIGYFPTYSLGNIISAQLFAQANRVLGDLNEMFENGNYQSLREWLAANVHSHGRRYTSGELVEKVTGEPLTSEFLTSYLKQKFGELYQLSL